MVGQTLRVGGDGMDKPSNRLTQSNGWAKLLVGFVPLLVAGLIGWGVLRSDVTHVEQALAQKANRETVEVQYQEIQRQLVEISNQLKELRVRP